MRRASRCCAREEDLELDVAKIAESWRHGTVIRSWLLDLMAEFLAEDAELESIAPVVADSGEGRWTAIESVELGVPTPVMTLALMQRFASQGRGDYCRPPAGAPAPVLRRPRRHAQQLRRLTLATTHLPAIAIAMLLLAVAAAVPAAETAAPASPAAAAKSAADDRPDAGASARRAPGTRCASAGEVVQLHGDRRLADHEGRRGQADRALRLHRLHARRRRRTSRAVR